MRRYLNEFLSDRRVIDYPRWKWQPLLQMVILTKRPFTSGANYRKIWNTRARREPAAHHHPRPGRGASRRAWPSATATGSWSTSPCATATPRRASVIERLQAAGCERIALLPALPAVFRHDHRHRQRRGLPGADGAALAAGGPHRAGLPRPSALHRGAGAVGRGGLRRPRPAAGRAGDELPRDAGALPRRGRPLPLPLPEDDAAAARPAGAGLRARWS